MGLPAAGAKQAEPLRFPVLGTRLYVGNIPYSSTEEELRQFFSEFGQVTDVAIVTDRETGRPRGFAFVSFDAEDAARAAEAAHGRELGGRPIVIKEARERGAPPPRREGDGARRPAPRPGGPPSGGGGDGRPRAAGPPPGAARPPASGPVPGPPPEEGFEEGMREPRRRTRNKKKGGADKPEKPSRARLPEDDEEPRGGTNWRRWLDEEEY